jgi:dTDP-4-dehydrorhamnose reductase
MKVLVTGAKGQLGTDVLLMLEDKGFEVFGYSRQELDITNIERVNEIILSIKPDAIIHTAAYTKVDQAESEPDQAFLINAIGTRNVAVAAEKIDAKLVYVSTDYVFDGTATKPIGEFEPTNPINVYGDSKLAGEQMIRDFHSRFFIVRTSWVYGAHGNNFVKTMLKLGKKKKELSVIDDQIGSPTYTVDLAEQIIELIKTEKYGIYHISNKGQCSWYEFAEEIFKNRSIKIPLERISTSQLKQKAKRPSFSVLKNNWKESPHWKESLKNFLEEEH